MSKIIFPSVQCTNTEIEIYKYIKKNTNTCSMGFTIKALFEFQLDVNLCFILEITSFQKNLL